MLSEELFIGPSGPTSWPSAAAPASGVSLGAVLRELYDLGERVASNTGVALTGGDVDDVFTVAGGPILLLGLWVDITTAVSANASLLHFESDPTVGALSTEISESTLAPDIASAALGDVFHINGDSQDVMKKAANGTDLPMMENQNGGLYVPVGGIDLKLSTSDPTTGAATIWMRYKPLARGVTVT
jgi:hypothetical protein